MSNLYPAALEVLAGIVGPIPAKMCISAASVSLGKSAETLSDSDFDAVANKIRVDMSRFASPALIEGALAQIKTRL